MKQNTVKTFDIKDFESRIKELFQTLTPREEKIMSMYYFETLSFADIGKHFRVTGERIKQIRNKACRKINHSSREQFLIRFESDSMSFVDLKNNVN